MSWKYAPSFDAAHRAAIAGGKPLIFVCPPAAWATRPLLELVASRAGNGLSVLALVPDVAFGHDLAATLRTIPAFEPVHALTSLPRAQALVARRGVRTLVAPVADAQSLRASASLPVDDATLAIVAWPEAMRALDHEPALEAVLADAPHLQRIILTEDAAAIKDLAERYAHRAPIAVGSALPPDGSPVVPVRVACTDEARRAVVARETLDLNHPRRWDYWDPGDRLGSPAAWAGALPDRDARPVELLIVADLPTGEALETFAARSKEIVVLIRAAQLPYLHRLTTRVRMFRLASAADRARDDAQRLRARLVDRLTAGDLDKELLALGPLFDRHDPAEVAAAAAALLPVPNAVDADRGPATVRVDLGRRDQIRPGDLVGILINRVGIARDQIGRITIRDAFCLVELETDDADRVARELTGETIRGRRMTARPERA